MPSSCISEPEAFSVNGQLVVKNTFLEFVEPKHARRRSRSTSPSLAHTLEFSHRRAELIPFEIRRRGFTDPFEAEDVMSNISTPSPCSRVFSWGEMKFAADVMSNSSTTRPCSRVSSCGDLQLAADVMSSSSTTRPCSRVSSCGELNPSPGDANRRLPLSLNSLLNEDLASHAPEPTAEDASNETTLMFRNLPPWYTRQRLEQLLNSCGFGMHYNFIYLPAKFGSGSCFGYAFVNMVTAKAATRFVKCFQDFKWGNMVVHFNEKKQECMAMVVDFNRGRQGLGAMVEYYRNNPVMHASVPEELRPAVYSWGRHIDFPEPDGPVKPPSPYKNQAKKNRRTHHV